VTYKQANNRIHLTTKSVMFFAMQKTRPFSCQVMRALYALNMDKEVIIKIEVTDGGELLLILEGSGNPMYQYIYREAAGVYWDDNLCGFKSTLLKEWSCSKWFYHIIEIVKSGLGIELLLSTQVLWKNIPEQEKAKIIENMSYNKKINSDHK